MGFETLENMIWWEKIGNVVSEHSANNNLPENHQQIGGTILQVLLAFRLSEDGHNYWLHGLLVGDGLR